MAPENALRQGDLLTIEEVAELVRTPPATIRDWIHHGKLASSRPGRRTLIRRSDLEALIAAKTTRRVQR